MVRLPSIMLKAGCSPQAVRATRKDMAIRTAEPQLGANLGFAKNVDTSVRTAKTEYQDTPSWGSAVRNDSAALVLIGFPDSFWCRLTGPPRRIDLPKAPFSDDLPNARKSSFVIGRWPGTHYYSRCPESDALGGPEMCQGDQHADLHLSLP